MLIGCIVRYFSFNQVSLEDGSVRGYDIRAAKSDPSSESKPSFTLHAHDKAACTLSYNPAAPNVQTYVSFSFLGQIIYFMCMTLLLFSHSFLQLDPWIKW